MPDWLAQRLWSGLVLVAAYEGTRRVGRAMGIPGVAAALGGLGYALAPRLLGQSGVLSAEVLPAALLPWALLPLILGITGRLSPRRAGLLSGVAVLCMGGVNAAATVAVLPLGFLVVVSRLRQRGGPALLGWWLLGSVLACAWWMGPLLLLGRYSPPFLDFIETSAATTSATGWANSVRGADHWVAFHTVHGQAWWSGAHLLMTSEWLAVLGMGVAAVGLVGLLHVRMPLRVPLTLSLVLGLLFLTVGNSSAVGSLVDEPVRVLLDGPLAALRNVHKADPLVRLPVALGFAHAVGLAMARLRSRLERRGAQRRVPAARRIAVGAVAAILLAGAPPLFLNELRTPGWTEPPDAWSEVAEYLDDAPASRALVVPGAGFGLQTWGWTIDEPIQGFADTPWATRSQVPLIPGPAARVLDAVERRLSNGHGSAGLADFLARAGITHVVLRRDLDPVLAESAATDRVARALFDSPGLHRTAGFGRTGFGDQSLIEVFTVASASPRATLVDARDVVTLDGGPEDVLAALDAGVLSPSEAVLVQSAPEPGDLVSDGFRRVERQFGRTHDAVSEVMTGSAAYQVDRPAHDYPGAPTVRRAEADYLAVDDVRASSSQGYPDIFGPVMPARGPAAAFDGRPETWWRSAPLEPPTGQWLQVDLAQPLSGGVLRVFFPDAEGIATVREAAVSFDGKSRTYAVSGGRELLVTVPSAQVHDVRISVVSVVPGAGQRLPVAIAEVALPGTPTGRTLEVPRPIGPDTTVVLSDEAPRRACVDIGYGPHCETAEIRTTEWQGLDRRLTVAEAGAWELTGSVVAGAGATALLAPIDPTAAAATADSVFGGDPSVSGGFAFDGNAGTPWLAEPGAAQATLNLSWTGERTVSRLTIDDAHVPATEPVRARIESSAGVRDVALDDLGFFEPLRARDGLSVTFYKPAASAETRLPLGIGEVHLDGLDGLQRGLWRHGRGQTGAACGLGPEVRIDHTVHRTEVTGTLQDVVAGSPLTWRVCDGPVELHAGVHRVVAESTWQFQPVSLTWRPADRDAGATHGHGTGRVRVTAWGDARRVLSVDTGPASILRIPENVNDGWRATLDGERLEPVTLDGWQQGYRLPAGSDGDVVLEFPPDRWYRAALAAGLVLAVALVGLALIGRRRPATDRGTPDLTSRDHVLGVAIALPVAVGALVLGGIPWVVGWAAGLVPPIRRFAPALGVLALLGSGVLVATSPGLAVGESGVWADATAAGGLGLLLTQVVRVRAPRRAGRRTSGQRTNRLIAQLRHRLGE